MAPSDGARAFPVGALLPDEWSGGISDEMATDHRVSSLRPPFPRLELRDDQSPPPLRGAETLRSRFIRHLRDLHCQPDDRTHVLPAVLSACVAESVCEAFIQAIAEPIDYVAFVTGGWQASSWPFIASSSIFVLDARSR